MELEQNETRSKRDSLLIEQGKRQGTLTATEGEWAQLNAAHEKWSTYSVEFIKEMRENARRQAAEIAEAGQNLELAGRLDLLAMRNRVKDLRRQLATDRKAVEQWEQTAAAELRRNGISDTEIASAFQMANPSLLKLIVGDTLTITDLSVTLARVRTIASRLKDGTYADDAMTAELSGIGGPDATMLRNPEQLLKVIELTEQDLSQQAARLKVAEDQEKARAALDALRDEHDGLCSELTEYDNYAKAWSNRRAVEERLEQAKQSVVNIKREIDRLAEQLAAQATEKKRIEREYSLLQNSKDALKIAARDFKQEAQRLALDGRLLPTAITR